MIVFWTKVFFFRKKLSNNFKKSLKKFWLNKMETILIILKKRMTQIKKLLKN